MKAKDYIESRLGELSSLHKNIGIRYEYNPFYSAHLIELDLTKIVSKREKKAIQKFQDIVSEFQILYILMWLILKIRCLFN